MMVMIMSVLILMGWTWMDAFESRPKIQDAWGVERWFEATNHQLESLQLPNSGLIKTCLVGWWNPGQLAVQ